MKKLKIYERTRWRLALIAIAFLVVAASISYTTTVASKLKNDEKKHMKLWADAQSKVMTMSDAVAENYDFTLYSMIMDANKHVPILLTDDRYNLIDAINYEGKDPFEDTTFFNAEIAYFKKNATPVIIETEFYTNYIFYRQSTLITSLEYFPYFQFAILGVLLLLSYFTFSFNRQAEQERVWVGMAKETAHQLGTPLTSLMGWIENINMMYPDDEDLLMIADEMNTDIELLKLVADRFSKIGAIPKLGPVNVYSNLQKHLNYVQQRASRKITFNFPEENSPALMININPLLFDWVIENLLKNALDALAGQGQISANVHADERFVYIDMSDSGKGIPKKSFKAVFQPGYSTKKRGWGLGLSLCKRIVENYHNGKIFVLNSIEGEGTTFRIQLPKIKT